MKKPDLRVILLFLITLIYVIIYQVFNISNILNTFIWLLLYFVGFLFSINRYDSFVNRKDKYSTIFLSSIIPLIIYFLSGLLFGYARNALNGDINNFFINLWGSIVVIFFQEYLRNLFISYSNNKKVNIILITIVFILSEVIISTGRFYDNFVSIFTTYLPICITNILLTYITYNYGYKCSILYRLIITSFNIFIPIFPNCGWLVNSIIFCLVPIINYIFLSYEDKNEKNDLSIIEKKKVRPISYIPYVIVISILFCFIIGKFNYKITAIMSNSMKPTFERGDAVILKDVTSIDELNVGDIIKFKRDNQYVIHRIYEIDKSSDNLKIITKGDNNLVIDDKTISFSDVSGKYLFKIKYIGYPSVYFTELLEK